jgi:hypothetical protein
VALATAALACSAPARSGGLDPGPTLSSVEVSPISATVASGDSLDFTATGRMSDGSAAQVATIWQATGGTINAAGRFRAGGTAGAYRVIAATPDLAHADTAAVIVTAITPPPGGPTLTAVTLTPAVDTLAPGASATFSASGHYSNGHDSSVAVTWSATGGTISSTGPYQAGQTTGTYRVVATATGAGLADTARVVVSSGTPAPTATVLFTESFEDASVGSRGWYDNTSPAITTAEKHGGGAALEMAFPAGAQMPTKGGALRHKFAPSDRVYVRYWVKYSANWVGSGVNYHPHEFYLMNELESDYMGPSATHLTLYIEHNYQNGGIPLLSAQDALNIDANNLNVDLTNVTEQRAVAGCNGASDGYSGNCYSDPPGWNNGKGWRAPQPMFTNDPASPGYKNLWHKVEAYYQLNSIQNGKGVNDGMAQYWFDGQLVIDKRNVLFRTGAHATMRLNQFLIAPWIGVGSPVAQTMWVDDLVVATGRVP